KRIFYDIMFPRRLKNRARSANPDSPSKTNLFSGVLSRLLPDKESAWKFLKAISQLTFDSYFYDLTRNVREPFLKRRKGNESKIV
ncbi:MAG: hypothetical protein IJF64_01625, partial [Clostridia bacterium]|nr:hypothetical protein [Clostridia bacterium]